jgi:tetratricopeptide (TPR) repeat protein
MPFRTIIVLALAALSQPVAGQVAATLSSAQTLFNQGKFQEAATAYRAIIKQDKSSALAYSGLVRSLLKLDDVSAANQESETAVSALPQSSLVHAVRGDVFFRYGFFLLAEREYTSALAIDDKCGHAILGLARVYSAQSRRSKAREFFARARELDPEDGDALYYWAITLPYPKNVEALEKHLANFRDDPERERHEHEYMDLIKALAGRRVWIPARDVDHTEMKLETILAPAPRSSAQPQTMNPGPSMALRGLGLRVKLNEATVKTLLLDTGASGVVIKKSLADKIGARRVSAQSLEGVGSSGAASGYTAWVDKIIIGDLEFHDCIVRVSMKDNMGDIDGLIGADVFDQYLVTIDFPGRKLLLNQLPQSGPRIAGEGPGVAETEATPSVTRVFSFGHLLLMPTRVGATADGLFFIDTGAFSNIISPGMASQLGQVRDSALPVQGASGQVKDVHTAPGAVLHFSRYSQPAEDLPAVDLHPQSKDLGTEVSGIVGFSTLRKMKIVINYRDGLVDFDYKP